MHDLPVLTKRLKPKYFIIFPVRRVVIYSLFLLIIFLSFTFTYSPRN
ncbi:hypothetical protein UYSO10_5621 [Kosakonia radicincitans]|nr:hypothetical protein UYSO10_5621 [Kosakonia radicincitans]